MDEMTKRRMLETAKQFDECCAADEFRALMIARAKAMRSVMKIFQNNGFSHDESFELIKAMSDEFKPA